MAGSSRVLVVGAGVVGLLTAVQCALAGHRVTLLDRGTIPDPAAGSSDQHRVLRTLLPNDLDGTRRLMLARRRWLELERLLRIGCFRAVGVLSARRRADADAALQTAAVAGLPVRRVRPRDVPQLRLPAERVGILEVQAGVLLAREVLAAAAGWLREQPAVRLRPGCAVRSLDLPGAAVTLAGGEVLRADLVLVAAGCWTRDLLPAPVVLHRQTMVYLHAPAGLRRWWQSASAAGGLGADGLGWLVPPGDGTLLKLSSDAVRREVATVADPEPRTDQEWSRRVLGLGLLADPERYTVAAVRHCHYATAAGTGGALLTRHSDAVWSRAACGGNGFATAPLVADRITRAALEEAA